MEKEITKKIRVYGIVQGVGFRPTVSRHADSCKIRGSVSNRGPYVEIFAQGSEKAVNLFIEKVRTCPPKRAAILKVSEEILDTKEKYPDFSIIESEKTKGEIFISPDIAICEECKEELYDPKDRRYLHPFINCTCCGPRLTILDALPYDRERTSMKEFPMCPECEAEYYNPESRRYDAQPVCCNMCGPEVYLIKTSDRTIDMKGSDAITEARRVISEGGVVAVKGIGGFHLCCDASNEAAVELLRKRKRRPAKPFAVMARNLEVVQSVCELSKRAGRNSHWTSEADSSFGEERDRNEAAVFICRTGQSQSRSDASICAGAVTSISISGWNQDAGLSRNDQWKCIRCANLQIG